MSRFSEKGYYVKENAPVYFTKNMDATVRWFEEILGWYSNIVERDESGNGCYGAVFEMLTEVELTRQAPFTGLHMFYGEPQKSVISFMQVQGIEKMYEHIISKGWDEITEIVLQPWGAKTCDITTIDGYIIKVFEG